MLAPSRIALVLLGILVGAPPARAQSNLVSWSHAFEIPGVDNDVQVMHAFNDGMGNALYFGGMFTQIHRTTASSIARWNGVRWSSLGLGLNGAVRGLAVFHDPVTGPCLFAAGTFSTAGGVQAKGIARWTGSAWLPVGGGIDTGTGNALAVYDDGTGAALYLGGEFLWVSGVTVNRIAKWDGANWSPLANGIFGATASVEDLAVFDDGTGPALFVVGVFTNVNGSSANRIAKWNGTTWSALGTGLNDRVWALEVYDNGSGPALYAAGDFTSAGGVSAAHLAKWNGTSWSALGAGLGSSTGAFVTVTALAVHDAGPAFGGSSLVASGTFDRAGGLPANRIARWKSPNWHPLGSGLAGSAKLASHDFGAGPRLIAGGAFQSAGGQSTAGTAAWDGAAWSSLSAGHGTRGRAFAMKVFDQGGGAGPNLFVGGSFDSVAGTTDVHHIARWNGSTWTRLGTGTDFDVDALEVHDDGSGLALYVGGGFQTAGGAPASRIARWDGLAWSAVGAGLNGGVSDLVSYDDGSGPALYAAGGFSHSGVVAVANIARWTGSAWAPVGTGIAGGVEALSVYDDGSGAALFAAGSFPLCGTVKTRRIARWDGSSWSPVGDGMDDDVLDLQVFDDGAGPKLYAGGRFQSAGGVRTGPIASWDGSAWSAVGTGVFRLSPLPRVEALALRHDGTRQLLYVGGEFDTAGKRPASNVAAWDGTNWSALRDGVDGFVSGMGAFDLGAGSGEELYLGGNFLNAGTVASHNFARWGRP